MVSLYPKDLAALAPWRLGAFLLLLGLLGCERGCARRWFEEKGAEPQGTTIVPSGAAPIGPAIDCPDGLARCNGGVVEVSRLATIPQPCKGSPERCACPWERAGECGAECVLDGLEVVVERARATTQLCAPAPDAGLLATPLAAPTPAACDDEQLYRCVGGVIVACSDRSIVATCVHGCSVEGAAIGDDLPVAREAAYAILCSR
jgi:hypothetical protein